MKGRDQVKRNHGRDKTGNRKWLLILTLVMVTLMIRSTQALIDFPKGVFTSPLKIPLLLAGNFGEIRNNHFHAGIDIKTMSQEGQPVSSIADGYVSRINISSRGYGKCLYITHPNGYTSVYAHLREFNGDVATYVKNKQYELESFEMDITLSEDEVPVSGGQVVAYSGNTGSSAGPHLHFEIRETYTEFPVNPLLFGYDIRDDISPVISSFKVYPIGPSSFVDGRNDSKRFGLYGSRGNYSAGTVRAHGDIGIAIETRDVMNNTSNTQGIFSIELRIDEEKIFYHDLDRFGFHETRYINSLVDYHEKMHTGRVLQKCFIDPNNRLSTYKDVVNRGVFRITDDTVHKAEIIVKDVAGNTSRLSFDILDPGPPPAQNEASLEAPVTAVFPYQKVNTFTSEGITLEMPVNCIYDTLRFVYNAGPPVPGAWSVTHEIHRTDVPVHTPYQLRLLASDLPERLHEKALIAMVNDQGYRNYQGGTFANDWITCQVRTFGSFAVLVDETPPGISAINIYNGKNMKGTPWIRMRISDNLSGIQSYRGTIDDQWILMEYDQKTHTLAHMFEEELAEGEHEFKLVVTDNRNNTKDFTAKFTR
ncbi:MAG: M23 family metallopeptidase [Flavobacteriales bacterium]|nr:M23 family metallopeptidase [Flavobacteriales bacterium]